MNFLMHPNVFKLITKELRNLRDDFAKINEVEFTQEKFNDCLKNINDEKTLVRIE